MSSEYALNSERLAKQYPDIARAKNLLRGLFADETSLRELGYTYAQIQYAKPVLEILDTDGGIRTLASGTVEYDFGNDEQFGSITRLPHNYGHSIGLFQNTRLGQPTDYQIALANKIHTRTPLSEEEQKDIQANVLSVITNSNPIFKNEECVINMLLLNPSMNLNDIDTFIRILYSSKDYSKAIPIRDGFIGNVGLLLGILAPYRAIWLDDERVNAYVGIQHPENRGIIDFSHWRKLPIIRDFSGGVLPVGKVPHTSKETISNSLK